MSPTTKLNHWIGYCETHGAVEVHQGTPPTKCHHLVRQKVTCNRRLQRVRRASQKWEAELERAAS